MFEITKKEFEESTGNIYNNQKNYYFETIINIKTYNLENAQKTYMEVTTCKTTKSEAKKLYNKLIQKDIDVLEREKRNETEK